MQASVGIVARPQVQLLDASTALKKAAALGKLNNLKILVVPNNYKFDSVLLANIGHPVEFDTFIYDLVSSENGELPYNLKSTYVVIRHDSNEVCRFEPLRPEGVPTAIFFYAKLSLIYESNNNVWMVMNCTSDFLKCGELLHDPDLVQLVKDK